MNIEDLEILRKNIELILKEKLSGHLFKVSLDFTDSPNPVCFFELDGLCFAQGRFWLNREYSIESMNNDKASELMMESGEIVDVEGGCELVNKLCKLISEQA